MNAAARLDRALSPPIESGKEFARGRFNDRRHSAYGFDRVLAQYAIGIDQHVNLASNGACATRSSTRGSENPAASVHSAGRIRARAPHAVPGGASAPSMVGLFPNDP